MVKDKIVEGGWYKLSLSDGRKYTGKCTRTKPMSLTFDIGDDENDKIHKRQILILHIDDPKSAVRLSPRYIETIETKSKGWIKYRYKGLFKFGEG
jgi:hypothetical protein